MKKIMFALMAMMAVSFAACNSHPVETIEEDTASLVEDTMTSTVDEAVEIDSVEGMAE